MSKPLYQQLHDEAVEHELGVVFEEPSVQPEQVHVPEPEEPVTEEVGSFLQDFGHLRAMVKAREVNDPMSSSGRWDDLQLDLRQPHIPAVRRDPVRRHLKLTLPEGVTVPLIRLGPALGETLGLKAAGGANKYALTSIKTDKWEHNTHERAVASGERKFEADERRTFANFDAPAKTATQMLGRLVRAMRFGHPSRKAHFEQQFRLLWSVRGQLRATLGVSPRKPVVKPKVVVTVAPKPLPPKPEYFDRLLAELGENAAKLGTLPRHDLIDDDQKAMRTKLMARQRFIQSTIGRWM